MPFLVADPVISGVSVLQFQENCVSRPLLRRKEDYKPVIQLLGTSKYPDFGIRVTWKNMASYPASSIHLVVASSHYPVT